MPDLVDSNVWLALSAPGHAHHARAMRYWKTGARAQLAFTRITALALVRLLTHGAVLGASAMRGREAWLALRNWLASSEVIWLAEPAGIDDLLQLWSANLELRGGAWTDAYLAAFATAADCRLVSFDRGFQRFPGLEWLPLTP